MRRNPGAIIGVNGLAGNLGIAVAALRHRLPGAVVRLARGLRAARAAGHRLRARCSRGCAPQETEAPARRSSKARVELPPALLARVFAVMTAAAVTGSLLFNFTTNGNGAAAGRALRAASSTTRRLLGLLLAAVYALASLAQVVVGRLIDRVPLKPLYLGIALAQVPLLALAAQAQGWWLFVAAAGGR